MTNNTTTPRGAANQKKFTFIAHGVEVLNHLLRYVRHLNEDYNKVRYWIWAWPICALISVYYLFCKKAYDVVDRYRFHGATGETVILRNFGWHFLIRSMLDRIIDRICQSVLDAQARGATVVGLGALLKDERLTQSGALIVKRLGDKLKIPIVHGDTLTAAVVYHQVKEIIRNLGSKPMVFLTGSTSKIGKGVAYALARDGVRVRMLTGNVRRFILAQEEARKFGIDPTYLEHTKSLDDGADCPVWIIGKYNHPNGKELIQALPYGAIAINFAVPDPLSPRLLELRSDVIHLDGGLMSVSRDLADIHSTLRLGPDLVYGCCAGLMVHGVMGWTHHEVGPVELAQMDVVYHAATNLGLRLAPWISHRRRVVLPIRKEATKLAVA